MPKKIIIDTDCGSDDAWAIAMALRDPNYEIIMMTCVSGNVRCHQAALNCLVTEELSETYYPPVYEGTDLPIVRDWVGAPETHGVDGLSDLGYVHHKGEIQKGNAVLKMLEALRNADDKEISIVALGPLTNIALAIRLEPETMRKVDKLWVMGTAGLGTGNVSPVAEFNIWQDPEACQACLDFGFENLIFVGWDACLDDAMISPEEIKKIREAHELGKFCIDSNKILMDMNVDRFGYPCLDMADPAAMAAALYNDCIETMDKYYCETVLQQGPAYGGVLVDFYHFSGKEPNAYICSKLKVDKYKEYIFRTLNVQQ